jgi:hypothetical protein
MADTIYTEHEVAGLKQAIGRESNRRRSVEHVLQDMNELFAQSVGAMFEMDVDTDKMTSLIWGYVRINRLWWKGDSHKVGVFTTIGDYTNKRGVTSKAHFTQNGKWLKTAHEGDIPMSYEGHFLITPEKFDYDIYTENDKWLISFSPK